MSGVSTLTMAITRRSPTHFQISTTTPSAFAVRAASASSDQITNNSY